MARKQQQQQQHQQTLVISSAAAISYILANHLFVLCTYIHTILLAFPIEATPHTRQQHTRQQQQQQQQQQRRRQQHHDDDVPARRVGHDRRYLVDGSFFSRLPPQGPHGQR